MKRLLLAAASLAAILFSASPAAADPLSAALLGTFLSPAFLKSTAGALLVSATTLGLTSAASWVAGKLFSPSQKAATQERQASALRLSIGEVPRSAVYGQARVAGSVMVAFNFGGANKTDWECQRRALCDHPIDAMVAYWVNGVRYPWTGNGGQAAFSNMLDFEFVNGDVAASTPPPARFAGAANWQGLTIASTDVGAGVTQIWVAYKADAPNANSPVWTGRPEISFEFRGKRLYDPRQDSTVAGGAGAHRWNTPSTHQWSDNAELARYDFDRGTYAHGHQADPAHLLVGRGLTAGEAPPTAIFSAANLCDEPVALAAGGTEKRYRASGEIAADRAWIDVEEDFAAAMAGWLIQPNGGVGVEPGHGKSAVVTITDADLVTGEKVRFATGVGDEKRVSTVIPRFTDPAQGFQDHAAPIRRQGVPRAGEDQTLALGLVTSVTQAQRCGEAALRQAQLERTAEITVPAVLANGGFGAGVEAGDVVTWVSDRHTDGLPVDWLVTAQTLGPDWCNRLSLREIAASVFSWTTADEIAPGSAATPSSAPVLTPLALAGVTIAAVQRGGVPGVRATWTTPVDPAVARVRLEVQPSTGGQTAASETSDPDAGVLVATDGVTPGGSLRARVAPVGPFGRAVTASAWTTFTAGQLVPVSEGDSLAANPTFRDYPSATGAPASWAVLGGTATRVAGAGGDASPWGVKLPAAAGVDSVALNQSFNTALTTLGPGFYVLEATVRLNSGSLAGAGVYGTSYTAGYGSVLGALTLPFATTPDQSGSAPGAGVAGRLYRFTRTLEARWPTFAAVDLYGFSHFSALGSIAGAIDVDWLEVSIRRATDTEIDAERKLVNVTDGGVVTGAGVPPNVSLGFGAIYNPAQPLSSDSSSITCAATTVTLPGGATIAVPSRTASGLTADTPYACFYDRSGDVLVAVGSGATAYYVNSADPTSVGRYVAMGSMRTQLSGGGFSPPPPPTPGGGGGRPGVYDSY